MLNQKNLILSISFLFIYYQYFNGPFFSDLIIHRVFNKFLPISYGFITTINSQIFYSILYLLNYFFYLGQDTIQSLTSVYKVYYFHYNTYLSNVNKNLR